MWHILAVACPAVTGDLRGTNHEEAAGSGIAARLGATR
jgi:hypothetical protein